MTVSTPELAVVLGTYNRLELLQLDPRQKMLELVDLGAQQWLCRLLPFGDWLAEQLTCLPGELGEHRREINDQLAEQVQRHGADVLQLGLARRVFFEIPRLALFDEFFGRGKT